jgi:excinuclease ABC subunit A
VEIGPEGGDQGGKLVFEGSPEELSKQKTNTGIFLSRHKDQLAGFTS